MVDETARMTRRENSSLTTLTVALRILTAMEAVALSAAAICMFDRQWVYASVASATLVAVYVVFDRRIERRMSEISLEIAADQSMVDLLAS
jgi:hypothetical protein